MESGSTLLAGVAVEVLDIFYLCEYACIFPLRMFSNKLKVRGAYFRLIMLFVRHHNRANVRPFGNTWLRPSGAAETLSQGGRKVNLSVT